MSQAELLRFARACVRDERSEALRLGREAYRRFLARRQQTEWRVATLNVVEWLHPAAKDT